METSSLKYIFLVEDDPDIQEIARIALSMIEGLRVEVCSSGKEALEKASLNPPQLILLDVMMPNMDGPTTLARLREIPQLAKVPVVFLTAKVQSHEVALYQKLGALDVISKPFDPMTLGETVISIWNKR